ncbi:hypothetical protein IU449_27045 [Nocardia higoensis]|uniref:Uncharacterized protein n=1 Tax=Nocardia higoensis TaxID=228599 RepID=A0ABS0DJR2_9NOCA|nr:hypothetical protein [Nocardia higoensis]MBF6358158.1 hypothetical protein [Nocardia higoensis]
MTSSADLFYGYDLRGMEDDEWESTAPQWWQDLEDAGESVEWEDEFARRLGWQEVPFPEDYPREDRAMWRLPTFEQRQAAQEAHRRAMDEYRATSPIYRAYAASMGEKDRLLSAIPVELATYGHCDGDTGWSIRVKASVQHVYGCDSIPVKSMTVQPEWRDQLQRFIDLLELHVPDGGPGWHLAVSWG